MTLEELKQKQADLVENAKIYAPMSGEDYHFLKDIILGRYAEWDLKTLEPKMNMYKSLSWDDSNVMYITGFYNINTFLDVLTHINEGSLRVGEWFVEHRDLIREIAVQFGPMHEDFTKLSQEIDAIENPAQEDCNGNGCDEDAAPEEDGWEVVKQQPEDINALKEGE